MREPHKHTELYYTELNTTLQYGTGSPMGKLVKEKGKTSFACHQIIMKNHPRFFGFGLWLRSDHSHTLSAGQVGAV